MAGRPMKPIPDDAPEELAALTRDLRELLRRRGSLSLSEVAERAELGKSTVAHAFGGHRLPNLQTFSRILDVLISPTGGPSTYADKKLWLDRWRAATAESRRTSEGWPDPPTDGRLPLTPPHVPTDAVTAAVHGETTQHFFLDVEDGGRAEFVVVYGPPAWAAEAQAYRLAEAQAHRLVEAQAPRPEIAEVARATQALNVAMDNLQRATAEMAAARAALDEANHRAHQAVRREAKRREAEDATRSGR